jgi:succinate dehydrogenase hydrophobic anchor subunit
MLMETPIFSYNHMEQRLLIKLETLPLIGFYAKTRGWHFVLAWTHRAAGMLLVLYVWFHVYTLTALGTPDVFALKMKLFQGTFFVFLEWALAVPVIFHAINGGRLILYEVLYSRTEAAITRGVLVFSMLYIGTVGMMMIRGDQAVSPFLFWLCLLIMSVCLSCFVAVKTWPNENSFGWKLQRISGSFLLPMIPAHLLFMHLQPAVGHDAGIIIARMQPVFIKIVDLALLGAGLYHGGYGLMSIIKDYLPDRLLHYCGAIFIIVIMGFFFLAGVKLTIFI